MEFWQTESVSVFKDILSMLTLAVGVVMGAGVVGVTDFGSGPEVELDGDMEVE